MKITTFKYPFDPSIKHHFIIAIGLGFWIFLFLYLTEPLDVSEFGGTEKLIYLPIYGLIGCISYLLFIPFQMELFKKANQFWSIGLELVFLLSFILISSIVSRFYYLYVIVANEPNPYSLRYYITDILFPAIVIILPIVIIGRFAFGKYKEKKLEQTKIEIKGEGTYESLRLFLEDLICIQSADNYIEVIYISGKEIKKSLIRTTLSKVEEEFPQLTRTHRSYIINPYHFTSYKSEKGKLSLELTSSIFVPVSTTYKSAIVSQFNFTTT